MHNERMEYLRSYLSHAGFMPSAALVLIFYVLLRVARNSMWRIALLSLPGTIAHELAHFVVGLLLLAKPQGFRSGQQRRVTLGGWDRSPLAISAF
jgi:hypothetical protein